MVIKMRKFSAKGLKIIVDDYTEVLSRIDEMRERNMVTGIYNLKERKKQGNLELWRDATEIVLYGKENCKYCQDCGEHLKRDNEIMLCGKCESGYYKESY